MSQLKLYHLFGILIAAFCLFAIPLQSQAATKGKSKAVQQVQKERLVLMPLRLGESDQQLQGAMETALVEGLEQKYTVLSGEQVAKKAREIFQKESKNTAHKECDETRCLQGITEAFQSELLAIASVTKQDGGYFLALSIRNLYDNIDVYSKSLPCRGCDSFQAVEKIKELVGTSVTIASTPPANIVAPSISSGINNAALNISCAGDDTGAEVWVNDKLRGECPVELKVPAGTIRLKVIKAVDADHERIQEQEVKIFEDSVKRIDIKLDLQLTAAGQAKEAEAKAKEAEAEERAAQAKAQRIAMVPTLIEENMVPIPKKNYAIGKYEVTQGEWEAVMGSNPRHYSKCGENCPVDQLSENEINEFIQKLNAKTGKQYRLPTRDEWIDACYGGMDGVFSSPDYCGGDNVDALAWYAGNSNFTTHPVGQKQPNGYGLYDMSGNVWEMVQQGFFRGGAWNSELKYIHGSTKSYPGDEYIYITSGGFRLARTLL